MRTAERKQPATLPENPPDADGQYAINLEDSGPVESFLLPEESRQLRNERLKAIQQAIADGRYDSDDLMEQALRRMLPHLEGEMTDPGTADSGNQPERG